MVNAAAPDAPIPSDRPGLRVLRSAAGVSVARNYGVAAARHDTILFTDDDLVVPLEWCERMAEPMRRIRGVHAVAAPVRMAVLGPVTSFLEHERAFDAAPLDARHTRTLVTANAGYRRDLFPGPPFDARRYPNFAEDTDLGLRIRDAGGDIAWVDVQRSVHEVDEALGSLVRRALQQGKGSARLYLQRRELDHYMPAPAIAYRNLVAGKVTGWRRYSEVDHPAARAVFTTLGLLRRAAIIAGYLPSPR